MKTHVSASVFELFKIGIGPSASHTVGPMRAAHAFVTELQDAGALGRVHRVRCELYGSLGATGRGHGTPKGVFLGLEGDLPATVHVGTVDERFRVAQEVGLIRLAGTHLIGFDVDTDVVLHRQAALPGHPNGMTLEAFDSTGSALQFRTYFSVGGGSIVTDSPAGLVRAPAAPTAPFPVTSGADLVMTCNRTGMRVSDLAFANELAYRDKDDIRAGLLEIWAAMAACVDAGISNRGVLPGGLDVRRRAPDLHDDLVSGGRQDDPLEVMDWVNLFALAVNEENAAGGRVVTAPTNGAAGIVPAVLHYYVHFVPDADEDGVVRFLLAAAAVGALIKLNASISGAEVGCQGEVGSAASMAAAGLCEVLGGTAEQVENAAEIAIEHHLGMTCDPVGGLVQIPCIERNAIASVKAINAARLALAGDGRHKVSLDAAIATMRETGRDMHLKYKETSRGGLAVNVVEC